jgi:hypothetical protein
MFIRNRKDFRFTKRKFNSNGKPINPNYKLNSSMVLMQTQLSFLPNTIMNEVSDNNQLPTSEGLSTKAIRDFGGSENTVEIAILEGEKENVFDRNMNAYQSLELDSGWNSSPVKKPLSEQSDNHQFVYIDVEEQLDTSNTSTFTPSLYQTYSSIRESIEPSLQKQALFPQIEANMNTELIEINDSDEDNSRSKHFRRHKSNIRRVTLETPDRYLRDFEKVGTYVNLSHSALKSEVKLDSPGGDSVISEVDEMLSAAFPKRRTTKQTSQMTSDSCLLDDEDVAESEFMFSTMTPFCSNAKSITAFKKYSRLTCDAQPESLVSWSPTTESISEVKEEILQFQKNHKYPTISSVYSSVITKDNQDESFLGL